MRGGNLQQRIPAALPDELFNELAGAGDVRIERIVSRGHTSKPDFWYDQDEVEFVLLVSGAAVLEDGEVVPMLDVAALMRLDGVGAARARSSAHVGRRRVLVVDDSELMRDVAASALREMGHEVLEAVDGRDALRVIAEGRPQLVVTDLDMPVMDGFALLEALRAAPETEHLPVVVFTSRYWFGRPMHSI